MPYITDIADPINANRYNIENVPQTTIDDLISASKNGEYNCVDSPPHNMYITFEKFKRKIRNKF